MGGGMVWYGILWLIRVIRLFNCYMAQIELHQLFTTKNNNKANELNDYVIIIKMIIVMKKKRKRERGKEGG